MGPRQYFTNTFWMDTQETFSTRQQILWIANQALKEIVNWQPDLIYVTDSFAFEFVALPYTQTISNNTPIVFSGITQSFSILTNDSNLSPFNLTGELTFYPLDALVDNATRLDPSISSLTFVCDHSLLGGMICNQTKNILPSKTNWPPSRIFQFSDFSAYQSFITNDPTVQSRRDLLVLLEYQVRFTLFLIDNIFNNFLEMKSNSPVLKEDMCLQFKWSGGQLGIEMEATLQFIRNLWNKEACSE